MSTPVAAPALPALFSFPKIGTGDTLFPNTEAEIKTSALWWAIIAVVVLTLLILLCLFLAQCCGRKAPSPPARSGSLERGIFSRPSLPRSLGTPQSRSTSLATRGLEPAARAAAEQFVMANDGKREFPVVKVFAKSAPDEMSLQVNDLVTLDAVYSDGWASGTSKRNGGPFMFPVVCLGGSIPRVLTNGQNHGNTRRRSWATASAAAEPQYPAMAMSRQPDSYPVNSPSPEPLRRSPSEESRQAGRNGKPRGSVRPPTAGPRAAHPLSQQPYTGQSQSRPPLQQQQWEDPMERETPSEPYTSRPRTESPVPHRQQYIPTQPTSDYDARLMRNKYYNDRKMHFLLNTALPLALLALISPVYAAPYRSLPALVPAAPTPVLSVHATGTQNYVCDVTAGKWALFGADATLFDDQGKAVGSHFFVDAVPHWSVSSDDSYVATGTIIAVASPDAEGGAAKNVPWLVTGKKTSSESGLLSTVSTVVRSETRGGVAPPPDTCNSERAFWTVKVDYTANYIFGK
ncbi:hypothetical protein HKX48_008656 [Thoreauomyces humboldtii]|nr:hypothetical protein HKX48_008656 [Thoreauomyces humboldtii]